MAVATMIAACSDGGETSTRNLSEGLVSFSYALVPGLGFCPQPGMLSRANIVADAAGLLAVSGSRLHAGTPGDGSCLPDIASGACLIERAIAPRVVTDAEARRIRSVFDDVRIDDDIRPECGTDDPCLIDRYLWLNRRAEGERSTEVLEDPCAPHLADEDSRAIGQALDELLP